MESYLLSFKCAECGTKKTLLNIENYAYKIGTKKYCCYTCYMNAFKRKNAKQYKNIKYLQKLNEIELGFK